MKVGNAYQGKKSVTSWWVRKYTAMEMIAYHSGMEQALSGTNGGIWNIPSS